MYSSYVASYNLWLCSSGNSYEQLGERQQRRRKSQIKDALNTTCAGLSNIGLSLTSIQLEVINENHTIDIPVNNLHNSVDNNDSNEAEGQVRDITYLMLKHGVSFAFYHELCARFKDLPRSYKV